MDVAAPISNSLWNAVNRVHTSNRAIRVLDAADSVAHPRNNSNHDRMIGDNSLSMREPFVWVRQGIADFKRIPGLSLLYGVLFSGLCVGIFTSPETFRGTRWPTSQDSLLQAPFWRQACMPRVGTWDTEYVQVYWGVSDS